MKLIHKHGDIEIYLVQSPFRDQQKAIYRLNYKKICLMCADADIIKHVFNSIVNRS